MLRSVDVTASTNDDARAWAREGAPHGAAVVARRQTAGRGRLGRRWESEAAGNVYLSVILRRRWEPSRVPLACLAAAIAVAEEAGEAYGIKWPNDVLAPDGRKVSGILAEAEWEGGELAFLVVGVGVNVSAAPALPTATSLCADGTPRDADDFARAVVRRLIEVVELPSEVLLDRWRARSATLGRRVRVGEVEGVAEDVDTDGALLVRTATGPTRVLAGDVELIGRFDS
ncbi:MAG: biotin--[acetyl-CoA-carboxylase] ligase [Alphaproteobacteria bacterium]|nr:biotin--[acetyl-CoA-carboxylase] ligase [Alphaproteobacteria bacterium]